MRVGRGIVTRGVFGDWLLAPSAGIDGVDLVVTVGERCVPARVGYLLAGRRVGRLIVVQGVVGELFLASSTGIDSVDLVVTVGCVLARVSYLLAGRRVGRFAVVQGVVGELFLAPSVRIDSIDLVVLSVVSCKGNLAWFARKVSLRRLGVKYHHEQSHSSKQPRRCDCQQRCSEVVEPNGLHYFPPSKRA